jgi:hypothetical protein
MHAYRVHGLPLVCVARLDIEVAARATVPAVGRAPDRIGSRKVACCALLRAPRGGRSAAQQAGLCVQQGSSLCVLLWGGRMPCPVGG